MNIEIRKSEDDRGNLVSVHFPGFVPENIYWITGVKGERGGHAHKTIKQILFCLKGKIFIRIKTKNGKEKTFVLKKNEYFFLDTYVWAWMKFNSPYDILLALADAPHDRNDYIY